MEPRNQQEERRHSQQQHDGEERRKQEHNYEKPIGDEESRKPAMNDE